QSWVLTVRDPPLPFPNGLPADIWLGKALTVVAWKPDVCPSLCPEIDSSSDAVNDSVPPAPEPIVVVLTAPPPVTLIVAAWRFRSPAPPGPSVEDPTVPRFTVRVEVDMETGPACPKPKVTVAMVLSIFRKTNGPIWKVPGRNPDMVIESDALSCKL